MLDNIKVEGFRGIKSGEISDLGQINIITGKNNSGKSAFLQSLYFLNENRDANVIPHFGEKEMFWAYKKGRPIRYNIEFNGKKFDIFYSEAVNNRICIDITDFLKDKKYFYEKISRDSKFKYVEKDFNYVFSEKDGSISIHGIDKYCTSDIKDFFETVNSSILFSHHNFLRTSEQLSDFIDTLQHTLKEEDNFLQILSETYEKEFTKLRYSPKEFGGWYIFLSDGSESRNISFDDLGDGARTSINILLQLFVKKPKIVLIDEIELHQHKKSLDNLCKTIVRWVKNNKAQLFASTHNLDAIKILSKLANESKMSALIHHCMLNEGILKARTIPSLDAETVIDLTGDIRYIDEYI